MKGFKKLSLEDNSLKYQIPIAFSLMSIIPLLSMAYFGTVNDLLSTPGFVMWSSVIIFFTLLISLLGYVLIRKGVVPVIGIASKAKMISEGQYDERISLSGADEVEDIAFAVNKMSDKIRKNIEQLQEYGDETAYLNLEIHKKVNTLANLMELGNLINLGVDFTKMSDYTAEKIAMETANSFCVILAKQRKGEYGVRSLYNNSDDNIAVMDIETEVSLIGKMLETEDYLVIDRDNFKELWQERMHKRLAGINAVILPMRTKEDIIGVMVYAKFGKAKKIRKEEINILKAFEKELVLGYQSYKLKNQVKSEDMLDDITGFYTSSYLEGCMEEELNRSLYYQRPCSLILMDIDSYDEYLRSYGEEKSEVMLKKIGSLLGEMIPPVGKIARSAPDEFWVLLPEKNKKDSIKIAELIRKKIEMMEMLGEIEGKVTVSAGVGENPLDGSTVDDIVKNARKYLARAKKEGKNKIVGE